MMEGVPTAPRASGPTCAGRWRLARGSGSSRGSATIEVAILAPALLALLGMVIVAGRISVAGSAVEHAAAAAARAASIARDAATAQVGADKVAREALQKQGIECQPFKSAVDVRGFGIAAGAPSSVTVHVDCTLALADVAVPGMPGSRTVSSQMTSPMDRYRGRS